MRLPRMPLPRAVGEWLAPRRRAAGLDVGAAAVKLVEFRRVPAGHVLSAAAAAEIAPADRDDEREKNARRAIDECFKAAGCRATYVVAGIGGAEAAVRQFDFPSMPDEDLAKAVVLEAAQLCPFSVDGCSVSHQVLRGAPRGAGSPEGERVSGIFAAAPADRIRRREELVAGAGRSCAMLDVEGLALLNCIVAAGAADPAQTTAALNLGVTHTTFAARPPSGLPFVRDLFHAGNGSDAIAHACGPLAHEIEETVRYFLAQERAPLARIHLSGGLALNPAVVDSLRNRLPWELAVFDPFEAFECAGHLKESPARASGPAFAVAAGLALRSI